MKFATLIAKEVAETSQQDFARRAKVSQTTISAWCRGAYLPPITRHQQIAAALRVATATVARAIAADRKAGL